MTRSARLIVLAASLLFVLSVAPAATAEAHTDHATVTHTEGAYAATIRRTSYGIPHILARDFGGAGFGQGWAYAEDRFCDLADQVVKVRSRRSRWFGPGQDSANLISDLGYLGLGVMQRAQASLPRLSPDARALLTGYAAGFNTYLARTGADNVHGWCAGQPWIGPVTPVDLLAYQLDIALQSSGTGLLGEIAGAQPPGDAQKALRADVPDRAGDIRRLAGKTRTSADDAGNGSNAWAVGRQRSATGRGMVVANPHFPWEGEMRFWESQLTVPGKLNVYGAGLGGLPGVQIGFNRHLAWSHTVAAGSRLTVYHVSLVDGKPTSYLVDGQAEDMVPRHVVLPVKGTDGRLTTLSRTLWSSRYGPMLDLAGLGAQFGWTTTQAFTYRDAAIDDYRLLDQWLGMDRANSLTEFQHVFSSVQGIPWVNTLAADDRGHAWYIDASATPNLSQEAIAAWLNSPLGILDGGDSRFAWVDEPGARSPGLIPYARQPQLTRPDYVFNANESHWLVNPAHPLTGFSPLQGPESYPQSPRARENAVALGETGPGDLSGADHRFTLDELRAAILSDRALTSDLLADDVIAACKEQGDTPIDVDGRSVDISAGCQALGSWDRRFDVDSTGAVVWREMIVRIAAAAANSLRDKGPLFRVGFDPKDPVGTPNTLSADTQPVLRALAQAVVNIDAAGVALDAPLGQVQFTKKGDRRIPVPGSGGNVGITNVVDYNPMPGSSLEPPMTAGTRIPGSQLTTEGYVVNEGTSFLMTATFSAAGPVAKALLTFSESADPASPQFADQTPLFTRKALRDCLFSERAIAADPALTTREVRGS